LGMLLVQLRIAGDGGAMTRGCTTLPGHVVGCMMDPSGQLWGR